MRFLIPILTFLTPFTAGALELAAPFADHAVLQREMEVPVWGWSEPGATIVVDFAGRKNTATAGKDGKWMLRLDPLEASTNPRTLTVTDSTGKQVVVKDILVGEVWMASGQSNMQWLASKCDVGRVLQKEIAERVEAGEESPPIIREAKVLDVFSALHPIERAQVEWNSNAGDHSAIAYAFAYDLYRELKVPIGILNGSFSSTAIEAWVPREGFAGGTDEYTRTLYEKILQTDPTTPEHQAAWRRFYKEVETALAANETVAVKPPGNLQGNRDATWLYNARLHPMVPYAIRGAIWNQGYANMNAGLTYYQNLHSLVRGWRLAWDQPQLPVYFHQFYCPGNATPGLPTLSSASEMRLGTWLARDIPHTGMASQIDIGGSVHYYKKTVPGQRLARHALKNQYGKKIVADGPMFKSYQVDGNKVVVEFDHAEGGLLVAEPNTDAKVIAPPKETEPGKVSLFYIADAERVWHQADLTIDGNRAVLTAPGVPSPRGVAYASDGVGFQPNLYNRALLPTTPFIYYDQNMVTRDTWPDHPPKVHGVVPDPNAIGLRDEWRKMPILSPQFRDNAVLQAGVPVTIWGSAMHDHGIEAEGEAILQFSFAGIEKTIPVATSPLIHQLRPTESRAITGGKEWRVILPPMEASPDPKTLKVTFLIDGEVAHERIATNIVVGDVWFVAASNARRALPKVKASGGIVRVMKRKAKRSTTPTPSRYSVCVSRTPKNRFASEWTEAKDGFAAAFGEAIHAKTGKPVGIIFMGSASTPPMESWIPFEQLAESPAFTEAYRQIGTRYPGFAPYEANVRRYLADWKTYWADYIPAMIANKRVPDESAWGVLPSPTAPDSATDATQTYNCMVHPFTPAALKGIVFLTGPEMVAADQGVKFGEHLSILANSWKNRFADKNLPFYYTVPDKGGAPRLAKPDAIKGKSTALHPTSDLDLIEKLVETAYP